jgi:hypothetical protein
MALPTFERGDQVHVATPKGWDRRIVWTEAEVLFKANQFGRDMWQVKFEDGRQDAIHASRIRLVERAIRRV